jgi:hypothetical protein
MDVLIILSGLIAIVALLAVALFYGAFAWGWVCFKFWYWFVLPVFTTLPELTLIQCIGLMMFISLFKSTQAQVINKEYVNETATNWLPIIAPPIVLFVGWIVKIFIIGS